MRAPANGSRAALILAKADGSGERVLVPAGEDNLHPVFVPHSQMILFLRSGAFEHHSPLVDNRRHKFDLFAVDATTGNVSALTNKRFYEISDVSVSSDGEQVMLTVSVYPEGDEFLIAPIKDAQNPTQVLQPKVPGAPSLLALYNAEWLPDNRRIVFQAATLPSGGGNYDYNVYRMTIKTGTAEQLTALDWDARLAFACRWTEKRAVLLREDEYSVLESHDKATNRDCAEEPVILEWCKQAFTPLIFGAPPTRPRRHTSMESWNERPLVQEKTPWIYAAQAPDGFSTRSTRKLGRC